MVLSNYMFNLVAAIVNTFFQNILGQENAPSTLLLITQMFSTQLVPDKKL